MVSVIAPTTRSLHAQEPVVALPTVPSGSLPAIGFSASSYAPVLAEIRGRTTLARTPISGR